MQETHLQLTMLDPDESTKYPTGVIRGTFLQLQSQRIMKNHEKSQNPECESQKITKNHEKSQKITENHKKHREYGDLA